MRQRLFHISSCLVASAVFCHSLDSHSVWVTAIPTKLHVNEDIIPTPHAILLMLNIPEGV